jgi:hypothetical protein
MPKYRSPFPAGHGSTGADKHLCLQSPISLRRTRFRGYVMQRMTSVQ